MTISAQVEIGRVVGRQAELAAGLQLGREQVDRAVVDHPPLGVPRLGPRVGVEQIEEAQRAVGNALEHLERVAAPQPDIGEMLVADVAERGGDAVEERLGADEAVVGQHVGAVGEMLARAEADLEMQRAVIAEQAARAVTSPSAGTAICGQQVVDQLLLALAQFMPASTARRAG